jgi:hypothetical protein
MERRVREIGDLKPLSVAPLVQVREEAKLKMSGSLCVTLLRQKGRVDRYNTAQWTLVHALRKGGIFKERGHGVSSFDGMSLGEDIENYAEFTRGKRLILHGIQVVTRHSSGLGIVPFMPSSA